MSRLSVEPVKYDCFVLAFLKLLKANKMQKANKRSEREREREKEEGREGWMDKECLHDNGKHSGEKYILCALSFEHNNSDKQAGQISRQENLSLYGDQTQSVNP